MTNNSTKSRAGYLKKFTGLGLDVRAEEIYSSSFAAAAYLQSIDFPANKKVYVVGEAGIGEELDLAGIQHCGGPADAGRAVELAPGYAMPHDVDVRGRGAEGGGWWVVVEVGGGRPCTQLAPPRPARPVRPVPTRPPPSRWARSWLALTATSITTRFSMRPCASPKTR